ncbi:MAG: PmbA/TldD family protein [Methanosaeta sp. SDB]|jgi:TldD protein|uniref:Peptidase U62, modulator of DNA gyrase n=1 Tax=Methanothrix harundinacea TaxID=301375 RepID=A0A117MCX2_9EURY|nr:MAG: PmbA/TldD family protein [Methanosaeta sp. SDB]KUK97150.1 MAG: Peptidase U62, modulator of DNA gyrase [Methanothrix harundinacea]MCP1391464.1 TldD/PmbA family protein [Methanothrix harundinacea]
MDEFHDLRVLRGKSTRIVLDNGELDEISESFFLGAAIRALFGGSWGFVQTESLDDLPGCLETAKRTARRIGGEETLKLASSLPGKSEKIRVKKDPGDLSLEEKVGLIREVEDAAKVEGVSSTQAVYNEVLVNTHYTSSDGRDLEHETTRVGFYVTAVASRAGLYQAGMESKAGTMGLELFDEVDAVGLARRAGETAVALLDAKAPKGGSYPVVVDQELGGVFVHEAVGHAAEADIVLEGGSILEGKIGDVIGSELVTVKDDPSLPLYGHYPFDDEGSSSGETVIVEDGVLRSYLHSRETAGRLGGTPRNARAQGCARPVVRMSNTYIAPAKDGWKLPEILEEMKDGVYLLGSRGGQVSTAEGVFQFNAKRGYLVEEGEIRSLLRDVSLSGHILEILEKVKAVGDDLKFNSGRCGKSGQLVPVSDGSPHLLIEEATVGGSG